MKKLIVNIIFLIVLYLGLGLIEIDGHSGLWHVDKTLGTTVFTDSWYWITGKAEESWEKTQEDVIDSYGSGTKKLKKTNDKIQDKLDDYDRKQLDELIRTRKK